MRLARRAARAVPISGWRGLGDVLRPKRANGRQGVPCRPFFCCLGDHGLPGVRPLPPCALGLCIRENDDIWLICANPTCFHEQPLRGGLRDHKKTASRRRPFFYAILCVLPRRRRRRRRVIVGRRRRRCRVIINRRRRRRRGGRDYRATDQTADQGRAEQRSTGSGIGAGAIMMVPSPRAGQGRAARGQK